MHSGITRQLQGHGDSNADKRALEKAIRVRSTCAFVFRDKIVWPRK